MPMNKDQGLVWKKIADAYQQWDRDRSELMALDELADQLPDIDPDVIASTLAEAKAQGRVDDAGEGKAFRLVPNH
ncbi:MAG TPA: hypothetical protein VEC01_06725 [Noviherbaspirillum sp.]|uniref:hypothetical protein n=1 Tax=Noviherbaspirillum sp. TaxID=1926288 RepID=UPI002D722FC3|nr:hypothetical protein [Noviherbaspirillum sp.]HYD95002.1 hypothetical protein [Noviherbaspirillum sp.]